VTVTLRVMSFNIQYCDKGVSAIADHIKSANPDIVLLQETDKGTPRSQGLDQAQEIADRAAPLVSCVRCKTRDYKWLLGLSIQGEEGIAILSRYRFGSTAVHPVGSDNNLLQASIQIHGLMHHFICVHFGLYDQDHCLLRAAEVIKSLPANDCVIFGGDFNTPNVQLFSGLHCY